MSICSYITLCVITDTINCKYERMAPKSVDAIQMYSTPSIMQNSVFAVAIKELSHWDLKVLQWWLLQWPKHSVTATTM